MRVLRRGILMGEEERSLGVGEGRFLGQKEGGGGKA